MSAHEQDADGGGMRDNTHVSPTGDSGDLGLRLPLHGLRLIEASAGTGKTFTLITVLLRLLIERGVPVAQLLAVTFTRAAAAELRQRLRQRLRAAQRVLDGDHDQDDSEAQAAAAVLAQAAAHASAQEIRDRVRAALLQLDEALIATIHGFCQRALREFGFRAGALTDLELLDSVPEIWDDVATALWRRAGGDAGDAATHGLLRALWKTPNALARDLPNLCDDTRALRPQADESEHASVQHAATLHALRDEAMARFDAAMTARRARTQDQLLDAVWRASDDEAFATALAQRWPLLLIDEFQDTDPRQWDLFRRIYAAADPQTRLLCLIGDPKQAIYRFRGGDLHTYLRARDMVRRQDADEGQSEFALDANYRSRPALLRALQNLFEASPLPFRDPAIAFHPLRAAGSASDTDLRLNDGLVPAITFHWLPQPAPDPSQHHSSAAFKGMRTKDDELALMTRTAVATIAEWLAHARLRDAPLAPSDIAVLTRSNAEAQRMQQALAAAGLGAALIGKDSVFASEAAAHLDMLLQALAEPGDPGRFRAALATPLLGYDAASIVALDHEPQALGKIVDRFERASVLWRSRGPLPALLPFATAAAARWLGEQGGARLLTDTLHLLELLQADAPLHHGPAEQLRWFAQMRAQPGDSDRAQLRLDADADLIQISTIHKAKGLEYAVVILPFLALDGGSASRTLQYIDSHSDDRRPLRAWIAKDILQPADLHALKMRAEAEEAAEDQRLLYVALTRAKYAIHAIWSRNAGTSGTALHWLLHAGESTGKKSDALDAAGMRARLATLAAGSGGDIAVHDVPGAQDTPRDAAVLAENVTAAHAHQRANVQAIAPARRAQRRFAPELRLHSFSALHARSEATAPLLAARPGANDEAALRLEDDGEATLIGTAFGNAVHAVLEAADMPQWRLPHDDDAQPKVRDTARTAADANDRVRAAEDRCPPEQRALLERALRRQGLDAGPAAQAQTARLTHRALNVRLPGDLRLCTLDAQCMRAEMGFHFRLRPTRLDALQALLDMHGYPRAQRLPQATLEGLMHGYIDLVYRDDDGRHYVLDYKTNRLPAYDPASLRHAIAQRDYDLQYLIYLVALRRWLRFRRGAAFDAERDLGGAVYLFLRGIELRDDDLKPAPSQSIKSRKRDASIAAMQPSLFGFDARNGVHVDPVSPTLLAALDALFDGGDLSV